MRVRCGRLGVCLCFGLAFAVAGCGPASGEPGEANGLPPEGAEVGEGDASRVTPPHPADLAASVADHYGPDELRTHALRIVEHERPSGSDGENAAIDYIVSTLTDSGVPVDVHEFGAYLSTPVSASLRVVDSDFAPPAITMAYSASVEALVAEVVDLGSLADLPRLEVGTGAGTGGTT